MAEQHKCCAHKWSGWHRIQCSKNGKIEREGKYYCGIHDPVAIEAKSKARNAKWNAEWRAKADTQAAAATKQKELERNAARYLFLRDAAFGKRGALGLLPPDEMDAAIDAEIAKGKP